MKKNIILLVVLLLLGGLAYLGISKSDSTTEAILKDRDFTIEKGQDLKTIKLSFRAREAVVLTKKGEDWYYGDRRANQYVVNNIIGVLEHAKIKYIPPKQAVKNVIQEINRLGIQVDLFDSNDKNFKSFFVGGNTHHEEGTYFLMQGSIQPYVMEMPFVKGGVRDVFLHQDFEFLDLYYLLLEPEEIASLAVNYPKDKQQSFVIEKQDDESYKVGAYYPTTSVSPRPVNQLTVEAYLSEFKALSSEAYENDNPRKDEIRERLPFAVIEIKLKDGTEKVLKYYPVSDFINDLSDIGDIEMINLQGIQRFFLDTELGDLYVVQKRLCKELFKGYNYFFR